MSLAQEDSICGRIGHCYRIRAGSTDIVFVKGIGSHPEALGHPLEHLEVAFRMPQQGFE